MVVVCGGVFIFFVFVLKRLIKNEKCYIQRQNLSRNLSKNESSELIINKDLAEIKGRWEVNGGKK